MTSDRFTGCQLGCGCAKGEDTTCGAVCAADHVELPDIRVEFMDEVRRDFDLPAVEVEFAMLFGWRLVNHCRPGAGQNRVRHDFLVLHRGLHDLPGGVDFLARQRRRIPTLRC